MSKPLFPLKPWLLGVLLVRLLAWVCLCVYRMCVCVSTSTVRNGYRLTAVPHQDSGNVQYYLAKELSQFPSVKTVALKRKPAQVGPVLFVCVAQYHCARWFL